MPSIYPLFQFGSKPMPILKNQLSFPYRAATTGLRRFLGARAMCPPKPLGSHRHIQTLTLSVLAFSLSLTAPSPIFAQTYVPPDRGLPGRREGGGTRGICLAQPTLTALMPPTNFGRTTRADPTLYWYIPQNRAGAAEFELLNEKEETVYKTQVPLSHQSGVIQITLPSANPVAVLEVGKTYHWYFSLVCDPQDRSGDVITEGWIERSAPDATLTHRLDKATGGDRAALYAEAGIWYDALDTLAELRTLSPNDPTVVRSWNNLLTSVGLNKIDSQAMSEHLGAP